MPSAIERGVGLGDDVVLFFVGGHVHDLAGDLAVLDLAVRRLDETELVDAGIRRQTTDQTDVRAFRCLDRAHPAVVAEVHVADLEAGPFARQTTRSERRQTAAVGEARQRIDLVHELRQLGGSEELLDRGDHGTDVDQRLGRDRLDVLGRHPLTDDSLHAAEADPDLVLDQLADRADASVGEVVLVVEAVARLLLDEVEHVRDRRQHLAATEHVLALDGQVEQQLALGVDGVRETELVTDLGDLGAELAVELVAPDAAEVVTAVLEERVAEVGLGRLDRGRLAGTGPLVDLDECLVVGGSDVALLVPLTFEEVELCDETIEEAGGVLLVVAERTQQGEDAEPTLAGDAGAAGDVLARAVLDVELHPLTAVRVDGALDELVLGEVAQAVALAWLEDHAGAADELGHDDTLGAVDDEGALVGHRRQVAHEDGLLFDLAGVAVHEPGPHEDRRAVGHVLLFAFLDRELGRRAQVLVEGIELELELERFGEVLDRADVPEGVGEPFLQEPLETLTLDSDQVREFERFVQVRERIAFTGGRASGHRSPRCCWHGQECAQNPGRRTGEGQGDARQQAILSRSAQDRQPSQRYVLDQIEGGLPASRPNWGTR